MTEDEIRADERKQIVHWLATYGRHLTQQAIDSGDDKTVKHLGLGAAYVYAVAKVIAAGHHTVQPMFLPRTMGDAVQ